jgi:hypothetical protein
VFRVSAINHVCKNWEKAIPYYKILRANKKVSEIVRTNNWSIVYHRVYIPKKDSYRPLGVPTLEWRIYLHMINNFIHMYVKDYLLPSQHGFIPGRGTLTAWKDIMTKVLDKPFIYECDLKQFFPSVDVASIGKLLESDLKLPLEISTGLFELNSCLPVLPDDLKLDESYTVETKRRLLQYKEDQDWDWAEDIPDSYYNNSSVGGFKMDPSGNLDFWESPKGVPQGAPTSPLVSILLLIRSFLTQTPSISYADDPIFYSDSMFEIKGDSDLGINLHEGKSGWVKRYGSWENDLQYLGLKYSPSDNSLSGNTRKGSRLKLSQEYRDKILDTFLPGKPKSWHTFFQLKDIGMIFSRLYTGTWKTDKIIQDFNLLPEDNSWLHTRWSKKGGRPRSLYSTFNASSLACQSLCNKLTKTRKLEKAKAKKALLQQSTTVSLPNIDQVTLDEVQNMVWEHAVLDSKTKTLTPTTTSIVPDPDDPNGGFIMTVTKTKTRTIFPDPHGTSPGQFKPARKTSLEINSESTDTRSSRIREWHNDVNNLITLWTDTCNLYESWLTDLRKQAVPQLVEMARLNYVCRRTARIEEWKKRKASPSKQHNRDEWLERSYQSIVQRIIVSHELALEQVIKAVDANKQQLLKILPKKLEKPSPVVELPKVPFATGSVFIKQSARLKQFLAALASSFLITFFTLKQIPCPAPSLIHIEEATTDWISLILIMLAMFLFMGLIAWYLGYTLQPPAIEPPKEILTGELERTVKSLETTNHDLISQVIDLRQQTEALKELNDITNRALDSKQDTIEIMNSMTQRLREQLESLNQTFLLIRQENNNLKEQLEKLSMEVMENAAPLESIPTALTRTSESINSALPQSTDAGNLVTNIETLFDRYPILNGLSELGEFSELNAHQALRLLNPNADLALGFISHSGTSNLIFLITDSPISPIAEAISNF